MRDISENSFEGNTDPLAAALSALMKTEMTEAVERKLNILRKIARTKAEISDRQEVLLTTVVERYLTFTADEKAEFSRRADKEPDVLELISPYQEMGIEMGIKKGMAQGLEQGLVQGKRDTVLLLLRSRFTDLPASAVARVQQMEVAELDALTPRLLTALTLADLGLAEPTEPSTARP